MKYDQFTIGQAFETKTYTLTKESLKEFAQEYDPQFLHLDEEKASQGLFKGLIASGIQTLAISFKLWIEEGKYGEDVIAGTAMNHIKFSKPVFPGDELRTAVTVIDKHTNKSENGIVTVLMKTFNQHDVLVFEGELSVLIKR